MCVVVLITFPNSKGKTPTFINLNLLEFSKHNLNRFYFILAFQTWFDLSWIFSFVFKLLLLLPMIIFFFFERYTPIRWLRSPLYSCCCGRYYAWYHTTSSCCWGRYYAGYHTTSSFWMILCWISLYSASFLVVDSIMLDTTRLCLCFCFFLLSFILLLCLNGITLYITRLLLLSE